MATSVLAPDELGSLKHYFGDFKSGGDVPPLAPDEQPSLLDICGRKFCVYNRIRQSLCVGSLERLLKLRPGDDLPVEEELPLTICGGFDFNQLSLFPDAEYCCMIWGKRAVAIIHFEQDAESSLHIKKEFIIAEKVYKDHPTLTVHQSKWSPFPDSKLILVLNSDSFLRVYNADNGESLGCFNLGPKNTLPLVTTFSAEISPETPVGFDFGPYLAASQSWMIFVLKPTGQIYCALLGVAGLSCFLNYYVEIKYFKTHQLQSDEDNFSHILCSKEFPVVLITAQESGRILHSILLPTSVDVGFPAVEDITEGNIVNGSYVLFTKERLRLPMGGRNLNVIQLRQDPLFSNRYLCVHGSGIHLITIKFVSEVQRFLEDGNDDLDSLSRSACKHLINWNIGHQSDAVNKALGTCYTSTHPQRLLCVLHDTRIILYHVPHPDVLQLYNKQTNKTSSFDSDEALKLSKAMGKMLRRSSAQPFYCSDQDLGKAERQKLLDVTLNTKYEQLSALEKALESLTSYVKSLRVKTKDMSVNTQKLLNARAELKDEAQHVAEAYEDWSEEDEAIQKRMDLIMYRFHQTFPILTDKEKEWQSILDDITKDVLAIKSEVEALRSLTAEHKDSKATEPVKLRPNQLQEIRDEITNQQNIITSLKTNVLQLHEKMILQ